MARYGPEHKDLTRRRIVDAAGRRFKSDGLDGSGIATLVADAGLTNGAFYGHFASKDDLIASVVAQQLAEQTARVAALPAGPGSVETFVSAYLSPGHRDDVAGGCPSAALLDEVGRSSDAIREAYTQGVRELVAAIGRHLDVTDEGERESRAIGLITLLAGALQAARAVTDRELSDRILAVTCAQAMAIASPSSHSPISARQDTP
ncbi:MAG TPA: TetR/AcrR family transcriptional regulator [Cellulomonadaceae bacterium]|nr:TetR/AcrR family transcriptional regulator [Cellulomonadaceae bacterium]